VDPLAKPLDFMPAFKGQILAGQLPKALTGIVMLIRMSRNQKPQNFHSVPWILIFTSVGTVQAPSSGQSALASLDDISSSPRGRPLRMLPIRPADAGPHPR